jgi:hypothetical protein
MNRVAGIIGLGLLLSMASNNPTGGFPAWHRSEADPEGNVNALSCQPGTTVCTAVDDTGHVLTSR